MALGSAAWSRARYFRPSSRRDCCRRAPKASWGARAYQPQYQPHLRRGVGVRAQEYSGDLRTASGHNLKDFTAFNARIPEARETKAAISFVRRACGETTRAPQVIRNSVRPVLAKLQANRGVIKALLVTEDSIMQSTGDVDQLAILSNLQSTLNFANLTLAQNLDQCEHISIDSSDSRILMWRIERCIFVVMVSRAVEHALYVGVLEEALVLLQQVVFVLAEVRHNADSRENP